MKTFVQYISEVKYKEGDSVSHPDIPDGFEVTYKKSSSQSFKTGAPSRTKAKWVVTRKSDGKQMDVGKTKQDAIYKAKHIPASER
jgi:hypothetical protein